MIGDLYVRFEQPTVVVRVGTSRPGTPTGGRPGTASAPRPGASVTGVGGRAA